MYENTYNGNARTEQRSNAANGSLPRFHDRILASKGLRYGLVIEKDKRTWGRSFEANEQLNRFLLEHSKRTDVYHACATFKEPNNRRASNAAWFRSIWVDVDLKPFSAAGAALDSFLDSSGLPEPLVNNSGASVSRRDP
jgi:hypothetical protein